MRGYFRKTILNKDKGLQAYVIGLALGDGNLSNPNGKATRLRITCDKKYPFLPLEKKEKPEEEVENPLNKR